jgi:hypothetical protein
MNSKIDIVDKIVKEELDFLKGFTPVAYCEETKTLYSETKSDIDIEDLLYSAKRFLRGMYRHKFGVENVRLLHNGISLNVDNEIAEIEKIHADYCVLMCLKLLTADGLNQKQSEIKEGMNEFYAKVRELNANESAKGVALCKYKKS